MRLLRAGLTCPPRALEQSAPGGDGPKVEGPIAQLGVAWRQLDEQQQNIAKAVACARNAFVSAWGA